MPVDIEEASLYLCTALKNTTKPHFIMTKEEFEELQLQQSQSALSLKSYLRQTGTSYSTYNYWRKKCCLWLINLILRVTFNATVLQAMRQPSRPPLTCALSTVWFI
jgi:hypothetical protein